MFELAVHLRDFPLIEFHLLPLVAERDPGTDHLPHVVGVEEADVDQENEADDEVLVEQYLTDGMLFPLADFFLDLGKEGHGCGCFHKNNDYF